MDMFLFFYKCQAVVNKFHCQDSVVNTKAQYFHYFTVTPTLSPSPPPRVQFLGPINIMLSGMNLESKDYYPTTTLRMTKDSW